tara:strand:+ start:16784 stop:18043 length:1260 start_codon:yes stop_codon:yes gene_type:complete
MIFIFFLNFAFFLMISVLPIIYLSRYFRLGFLNPLTIPFFIYFPVQIMKVVGGPAYILEEGLGDVWFNFALLMTNVELVMQFLLLFLSIKFIRRNYFFKNILSYGVKNFRLKKSRMLLCSFLFLFLFFIFFWLLSKKFGLLNWISDPRTGYQFYRAGAGHWYALSLLFLSSYYAIALLYCRSIFTSLIVFVVAVFLVFLLGSKGFVLSYLLYFMIVLWYKRSPYLSFGIFFMSPLVFLIMLFNFNPSEIEDVLKYFDYYVNSAMYYKAYFNGDIDLYYGYLWVTDFYKYIPRVLYESKPFVYGFLHVNEFFYPGAAEATHTPAFGGPVGIFADFGIVGLIFFSFFDLGYFFKIVLYYNLFSFCNIFSIRNGSVSFGLFLWLLAPSFLVFFGGFQMLLMFLFIYLFIIFINRSSFRFRVV